MGPSTRKAAVSFDLGQTLLELDEDFLNEKAQKQGYRLQLHRVRQELPVAWHAYNVAKANRATGYAAWSVFMHKLLERVEFSHQGSGERVGFGERELFVRFLFSDQPERNLWRRPIAGVTEMLSQLLDAQIKVGVLTNSEGRAKELIDEVGFGKHISVVVDSGVEGIEKPDPRIFRTMATRLEREPQEVIHIGDSYEADVLGALGVGMTAVWFVREPTVTLPPGVFLCRSIREVQNFLLSN